MAQVYQVVSLKVNSVYTTRDGILVQYTMETLCRQVVLYQWGSVKRYHSTLTW